MKKFVKLARIMKQYTTPEQTAKLIELGFEMPKSIEKVTYIEQYGCGYADGDDRGNEEKKTER